MTAQRLPPARKSLLAGPIRLATRFVLRFPQAVLIAAASLALLAVVVTAAGLEFRTSRLDLLNPSSGYNQRWLAYLDEFGREDDAIVVVEGEDPGRVVEVMDKLVDQLSRESESFTSVWHRYDLSSFRGKGLHFAEVAQLERLDQLLVQLAPIARGHWNQLNAQHRLQAAIERLRAVRGDDSATLQEKRQAEAELLLLLSQLQEATGDRPPALPLWPALEQVGQVAERFPSSWLTTPDGKLGTVLLRLRRSEQEGLSPASRSVERLREVVEDIGRHESDVKLGVTGLPVLEDDEMRASQSDMLRASLISLVGVAALFIAGFGVVRHPLMTVATLLLAMAWSFGYVTLAIGHLNILSVSFGVILIGLGIDFGIHYVARYQQLRAELGDVVTALEETAVSVGPGIVTGGVTTALAFCTAALTDFTGVAELGLIAGGGILLCVAAAILVLPALVFVVDRHFPEERHPVALPLGQLCQPLIRFPRLVMALSLLVSAGLAVGLAELRFDHNLLNLQPRELESVQLERRLLERSDRSVWFALSMADTPAELLRRKFLFEQLPNVERTEEVASLLPDSLPPRQPWLRSIQERLANLPETAPLISAPQLEELDRQLQSAAGLLNGPESEMPRRLRQTLRQRSAQDTLARLSRWQQQSAAELLAGLRAIQAIGDLRPPRESDLPAPLADRFVGRSGQYLLKVYARGDIWDMAALSRFVNDVESVDPRVTGHPVQTYYASRQMKRSYVHAAIYSLLAVAIVLMLDFNSVRCTLLALVPLALGMVQLFGILGLLDIPLNPANLIVLPLILGIGIDDGVHVVHDFLRQRGRYRLSDSTATAVLLTSATTMVGFGSMMFARHQGLQSLGQVLTIGVFCCLVNSVLVLPTLLSWISRGREESGREESGREESGRESPRAEEALPLPGADDGLEERAAA